jgi:hypothetical protein
MQKNIRFVIININVGMGFIKTMIIHDKVHMKEVVCPFLFTFGACFAF